jgi:methylenetetrahydrofolate dehydrogenase (NADP+)/methenyltetrahydrofolate cyclohydrolase
MATIIDGKEIAKKIKQEAAVEASQLKKGGIVPGLAVVLVGSDPASRIYVKNKKAACAEIGIESFSHELPEETSEEELLRLIDILNGDAKVHGILVQLPLPSHLDEAKVIGAISPDKDVDGFHPYNLGKLLVGEARFVSCTPAGILELIDSTGVDIKGKRAVVAGRSNIVGKPVAILLLERHATVTICHSRTKDLAGEVAGADILVAAIGRPEFIRGSWIKEGAVVIDVGINRGKDGKLKGDVEFDAAARRALAITPVPGGVGPMTIAMLMKNTIKAAKYFAENKSERHSL